MRPAVLIACETSGALRRRFGLAGCDAWSCDLLPADDGEAERHIQGDAIEAAYSRQWDLLVAHPPCTFLTGSAAWAFKDGPYHQRVKPGTLVGAERREARAKAIAFAEALWDAPAERVCIENPAGSLSTMSTLGKATQYIQPNEYGEDASKKTGLWLKRLPALIPDPAKQVQPRWVCCGRILDIDTAGNLVYKQRRGAALLPGARQYGCPNCRGDKKPLPRWGNQCNNGQNKLTPSDDRWKVRSETYPGIADAIVESWAPLLFGGNAGGPLQEELIL